MTKSSFVRFTSRLRRSRLAIAGGAACALILGGAITAHSLSGDLLIAQSVEGHALAEHLDQADLNTLNATDPHGAFDEAFEAGDTLFATNFLAVDGVGAKVHAGERFTRTPRSDQTNTGEWATHTPKRATGPNASSCVHCHFQGEGPDEAAADDGGGQVVDNAVRDPLRTGLPGLIQRNAPHLFGMGAVQLLAQEMTTDLLAIRNGAGCNCTSTSTSTPACSSRNINLITKGVNFGTGTVSRASGASACVVTVPNQPNSGVPAVSADLVVKPFQWKGVVAFVRAFQKDAGHNELGMQANEILATDTTDGDADSVTGELTVGDLTALAVYGGAQPRPTTSIELGTLGIKPAVDAATVTKINAGAARFNTIQCNTCHVPQLLLNASIYSEPSTMVQFRDGNTEGGRSAVSLGILPTAPIHFDITTDIPDNQFVIGGNPVDLGNFKKNSAGKVMVNLYGDLRRHQLGTALAEQIDEQAPGLPLGKGTFLTENLWGAGSTAPYMHDGRASTLTEAILLHHGEAETQRTAFTTLTTAQQQEVIAFLKSLVLFKQEAP
jgi:hypothetical protein